MKRFLLLIVTASLLFAAFPAGSFSEDESFTVAASFYPIYVFAQNVAYGTNTKVLCMTSNTTGCLHDYQLLPGDLTRLEGAGLLLINGAGMEQFLDDITAVFPSMPVVSCTEGIELIMNEDGEANAHVWLDPENAAVMTHNIGEALAGIDAKNADLYRKNADAYILKLKALDEELTEILQPLSRREIVTFHEAFPYFAKAYDLQVIASVTTEPDESISPRKLALLCGQIAAAGNPPLFAEPQYSPDAALAICAETGASLWELDPVVTGDGSPDSYISAMRKNAEVLAEALSR